MLWTCGPFSNPSKYWKFLFSYAFKPQSFSSKPQSSPSSTSCVRSTCKLSLGRLKHYPFMVPQGVSSKCPKNCFTFGTRIKCLVHPAKNQDFRCLPITFHVTGCLQEWMFGFLSITMSWQLQSSFGNKGLIRCSLLGRLDIQQEQLAAVLTTYAFFTLNP